jgi:hypothetical protein
MPIALVARNGKPGQYTIDLDLCAYRHKKSRYSNGPISKQKYSALARYHMANRRPLALGYCLEALEAVVGAWRQPLSVPIPTSGAMKV